MLNLFDLLQLSSPSFVPEACKLHFARPDFTDEHPLELFKRGTFDEWQRWQTKRNFSRPYVVSLVMAPGAKWLFAGIYSVDGEPESLSRDATAAPEWNYPLTRQEAAKAPHGRVVISYDYRARQPYPYAEKHKSDLIISGILSSPPTIANFNGFRNINISFADLRIIVGQSLPDWQAALSSVKGVYLITDPGTGKAYVGKADGLSGFWGRFCTYAETLHGTNHGLMAQIEEVGIEPALNWRLTILEVVDLHASTADVYEREVFWKNVLMTRAPFGYNHN